MKIDTFRKIEEERKISVKTNEHSALEEWYESVRDTKFENFRIDDLGRAVRQELYLEYLFPYVMKELRKDILSGSMYDGELLVALSRIDLKFMDEFVEEKKELYNLINQQFNKIEDSIRKDVDNLLINLKK